MADYATLLRDHVTLKCRSIDRILLQAFVPKLQTAGYVCRFLRWQRGFKIPSSAAFGKIGEEYVKRIRDFAKANNIPVVRFEKGQNKEKLARPYFEAAAREGKKDRVVLIGVAQEKARVWRSWKAKGQDKVAHPHMEWGRQMAYINHFYFYDLAFRHMEVSDTCVFDRPQAGRMWFEGVIRDHLDVGRPHQVSLVFDRNIRGTTPGIFQTRVITKGTNPALTCYYKSSLIKQYFKEGKALRTETVICNTRDFGIGRRVCAQNWNALRAVGESANRRLCDAELADAQPAPDVATFDQVTRPSVTEDGLYAPGLRFGDPRVMAILASLVSFCHLVAGFTNRQLVERVGSFMQQPYRRRQATYDLRRLKRKGLISRIPHAHRYQLTSLGRRVAVLFTKTYGRTLAPGLTMLDLRLPDEVSRRSSLAIAWRQFEQALEVYIDRRLIAA